MVKSGKKLQKTENVLQEQFPQKTPLDTWKAVSTNLPNVLLQNSQTIRPKSENIRKIKLLEVTNFRKSFFRHLKRSCVNPARNLSPTLIVFFLPGQKLRKILKNEKKNSLLQNFPLTGEMQFLGEVQFSKIPIISYSKSWINWKVRKKLTEKHFSRKFLGQLNCSFNNPAKNF